MKTYNYDTQEWVEDDKLKVKQLKEELNLLKSDKGLDYSIMIGVDRQQAIKDIEARIKIISIQLPAY